MSDRMVDGQVEGACVTLWLATRDQKPAHDGLVRIMRFTTGLKTSLGPQLAGFIVVAVGKPEDLDGMVDELTLEELVDLPPDRVWETMYE